MRAWLALLVLVPLIAGCLEGTPPEPSPGASLACFGDVCNFKATVDPEARQANELTIAVNPTDPDNIIASGKDYTPDYAGECVWDGIYTTKDGGRTWKNANVPGSNWRRLAGYAEEPVNDFSKFWCATDPVVAFGPDGTAYWSVMPYQCDRASGSKLGREFVPGTGVGLPEGGLNDWFWTCSSMYVLVSHDGGETWPTWNEIAFGPRLEHDKQWMSVAPDGRVLLCWDRDPSYQATGIVPVDGNPASQLAPGGLITCSVSSDKGESWTAPVDANEDWPGFLPWVDWDASNRAWMALLDGANVQVTTSADGLVWETPVSVGSYQDPPPGGPYGWPVLNGSTFRIFALPSIAVDRSGGPYSGSAYVVWFDHSSGFGRTMLSISRDGGKTWSEAVQVRDGSPNANHDQFMPAVSVGPDGTVDVVWYDRRDDPANHLFTLYYAYSTDGGRNWSPDLRVGEELLDEQYSHHQNGMVFLGDYIDIDSSEGKAHLVWVDTRDQKADVYVATVERPGARPMG